MITISGGELVLDEHFDGMDEKQIARLICREFAGLAYDAVPECATNIDLMLKRDAALFSRNQRASMRSRLINRHLANVWGRDGRAKNWVVDNSGFCHLTHTLTGARVFYRAIDPTTGRNPAGGHTVAAKARYTQAGSKSADAIAGNVFGYPDMSDVNLMLVCDYDAFDSIFLRVYKPIEPGSYKNGGPCAYSFPILPPKGGWGSDDDFPFIPDPEDELDILTPLLDDETENVTI